jgi:hypothetical protein
MSKAAQYLIAAVALGAAYLLVYGENEGYQLFGGAVLAGLGIGYFLCAD